MAAKGQGVMSRRLAGPSGRKVFYSADVARRVLERVETGEALRSICADPSLPHRSTITAWIQRLPVFAAKLNRARTAAGWHMRGGRKPRWDESLAAEIYYRMSEGESLTAICRDPQMPSFNTVWKWRLQYPAFGEAVALAQRMQAERLCDEGWEIACAVTPETAYATRVKLGQLRWTAAALGPKQFGKTRPMTTEAADAEARAEAARAAAAANEPMAVLHRHFMVEEREDGMCRVVTFCPDPQTRQLVREPNPGPWERPTAAWFGVGTDRAEARIKGNNLKGLAGDA